jgi:hypothetical protein
MLMACVIEVINIVEKAVPENFLFGIIAKIDKISGPNLLNATP